MTNTVIHTYELGEFTSELYEGEISYVRDEDNHCARIVFNRPEQLNALPLAGFDYIKSLIKRAERDEAVKVIVLEGMGDNFGTGANANELGYYIGYGSGADAKSRKAPTQRRRMIPDKDIVFGYESTIETVARCMKVVICKVRGYCYGAHLQLAVAADIVVATDNSMYTHPAWRYLGPLFNYAELVETVGLKKAKEMMLTCRPLNADEALRFGLITRAVADAELDETVDGYVAACSMQSLDGIAMGKGMMEIVMDSRGFGIGASAGWIGHGWLTNLQLGDGDWNFMKSRRDKGLGAALRERDRMVPAFFRQGEARKVADSSAAEG